MKSLSRYLLLVLISSVSLSSFSTQLAQNPSLTLRTRIHQQLSRLNPSLRCEAVFSQPISTTSTTRGITRGATRGIQPQNNLAAKVEEYSQKFSEVIKIEFDLPYGHESDPKSFYFLKNDPYEGPNKMKIYKELGVNLSEKSTDKISTWMDFARNFRAALEKRNLEPKDFLVPSLVFFRTTIDNKKEYKAIDPLSEALPEGTDWIVLNKDIEFNLPFSVILTMMREGKFPLLDAIHDTAHFVSFLRFTEFTSYLREGMTRNGDSKPTKGFQRRMYWLAEALSVLDPNGAAANQEFLDLQKRPTDIRDIESIETELAGFSERKLLAYSYKLARHFESQLRDIAGGQSNPAEKWYYLSESFKMSAKDLLSVDLLFEDLPSTDLSNMKGLGIIEDLSKTYFDQGPVTLNANPKQMTNETSTFSFSTFVTTQKLLTLILHKDKKQTLEKLNSMSRAQALSYLIKYTSRLEHLLTIPPFSYKTWAQSFLKPNLDLSDPVSVVLTTVFGNNIVKNYYLGIGADREK